MTQTTPVCPEISDALIAYLDYLYPERSATASDVSLNTLVWQGGQRSVVRHLKHKQEEQIEHALQNRTITKG